MLTYTHQTRDWLRVSPPDSCAPWVLGTLSHPAPLARYPLTPHLEGHPHARQGYNRNSPSTSLVQWFSHSLPQESQI